MRIPTTVMITDTDLPLLFETTRYWGGATLAGKLVNAIRNAGGEASAGNIKNWLIAKGILPYQADNIIRTIVHPSELPYTDLG